MRRSSFRARIAGAVVAAALTVGTAASGSDPGLQAPSGRPATGLILGQVVDADSGRAVAGVVVTLGGPPGPAPSVGELLESTQTTNPTGATRRTLTAADGRFLFRDVARGRYALITDAAEYVRGTFGQGRPSGPGQSIDLADDQKLGGVSIRIWKYAAVSGTVVDDAGEPAVGVLVRGFRRVIGGGRPRFSPGATSTTDDRGMYRLAGLVPGDYVVGVIANQETAPLSAVTAYIDAGQNAPRNNSPAYNAMSASAAPIFANTNGLRVGDFVVRMSGGVPPRPAPTSDGRMQAYQTQFFPGAPVASQASLISIKSAEDRQGINLNLRLVPTVRVSGRVTGPAGPGAHLGITLVPPGGSDLSSEGAAEAAGAITDGNGAFTFLGIPAGQYLLKIRMYPRPASLIVLSVTDGQPTAFGPGRGGGPPPPPPPEPTLWALMPVTVGETDITDLSVALRTGIILSGRVEFSGTRAAPIADQIQRMSITLQTAEGRTSSPIAAPGRATPDGAFRTAGYPAGRFILAATTLPPGWALKSAMHAGRDISVEPIELIDSDVSGVVMTFTDQTTELSGTVTGARGPDAGAEVIAFPADSTAWREIGVVARRGRSARVSKDGAFVISGLPAGEYFVAAIPTGSSADWRDPKVLDTLVGTATRVTLGDGEKKSIAIRTARRPGLPPSRKASADRRSFGGGG
jgi:hypothetical protein